MYPKKETNTKNILATSMVSKLDKRCSCCQSDTKHDETFKIEYPPEVLVMVIKIVDQTLVGGQIKIVYI